MTVTPEIQNTRITKTEWFSTIRTVIIDNGDHGTGGLREGDRSIRVREIQEEHFAVHKLQDVVIDDGDVYTDGSRDGQGVEETVAHREPVHAIQDPLVRERKGEGEGLRQEIGPNCRK